MKPKESPCGSSQSMSLADKIKFVDLADKNASPVGYKKALGLTIEQVREHFKNIDSYREHVSKFRTLIDLMKARKLATTVEERRKIQAEISKVKEELENYEKKGKDTDKQDS